MTLGYILFLVFFNLTNASCSYLYKNNKHFVTFTHGTTTVLNNLLCVFVLNNSCIFFQFTFLLIILKQKIVGYCCTYGKIIFNNTSVNGRPVIKNF